MLAASGKRGKGLRSLASAARSANLWPEPAKNLPALAGFTTRANLRPGTSLNSEPTRCMVGAARLAALRDHGTSIEAGLGIVTMPTAPASRRGFQRSTVDP